MNLDPPALLGSLAIAAYAIIFFMVALLYVDDILTDHLKPLIYTTVTITALFIAAWISLLLVSPTLAH